MGWIAQFLSRAVVTGFLFGAAIDVVIGELPKLTGTKVTGSNPLQELWSWLGSLGDASLVTVLVGVVALVVVFGLRVIAPRIPGALVLVVGGLLASWLFDLGAHGVALVGEVPRGLPSLGSSPSGSWWAITRARSRSRRWRWSSSGSRRPPATARTFAARHRYRIDINQESVAQGMANVGAGLFQGMPVSTSLSASSLNDHSGARTGLASLTSGVIVLLTLLVLGAAVLGPAQAGARRPDHRGGGHGHDGRARDAPPRQGAALRLLDRDRGDRRDARCSACSPE